MIPVLPVIELMGIGLIGMLWYQIAYARSETGRILKSLKKYVSPTVAHRALREESFVSQPTVRKEISIFFSDIRGFTNWSERKEPEEVTQILNDYLAAMTDLVNQYGGTLDKFIGDCVMVIFNAPEPIEDHPVAAIKMAIAMQEKITELSEEWRKIGREPISVGMGINTGYATVGNFGSELFSDYTAIGNSVNLAARIESVSHPGQILVSETTRDRVQSVF